MARPLAVTSRRHPRVAALALAAAVLAAGAGSAAAQGTAEQQEACTPDALKLCSATIPDIPKTTACMKAHVAELSPRCRAAFADATGGAAHPHTATRETTKRRVATRHVDRAMPAREAAAPAGAPRTAGAVAADNVTAQALIAAPPAVSRDRVLPGLANYRAQIARTCREGYIDAFTCRNTLDLLDGRL